MKKVQIKFRPKAVLSLLMATALTAVTFAGCSSPASSGSSASSTAASAASSKSDKVINLTYWEQSSQKDAIDPITEEFNKSNSNIHVTVSYFDTDGIKTNCKVAAASGSLPSMWDNWGGSLAKYFVDNGCTYDLTAYAKSHKWSDYFNNGALQLCTFGDQVSGYPIGYNVLGVFYKKSIFDKYSLKVPTTMEELESTCETLTKNKIVPFSTSGLYGWHVMRVVEQFVEYYAGAQKHDQLQQMSTSWNSTEVVKALDKYQQWCKKGYFPAGFLTNDPNNTLLALASGKSAMDIEGQWMDSNIVKNGLKLSDYGWFSFPNNTGRMSAFANMIQFNKKLSSDELDASVKYADFVFKQTNIDKYSQILSGPLPIKTATMPTDKPDVKSMLDNSSKKGTFTITDQAFPSTVADVLFKNQDALYSGTTTPKAAADAIQKAIDTYKTKK